MKSFKRIIGAIIILIVVAFAAATWFFSGQIIAFAPRTDDQIIAEKKFHDPSEFGVKPEEVTFTTREWADKNEGKTLTISGWFIPGASKDAPVFIVLHGKGDSRVGVVKYVGMLARAGYAVLAYDHRHHGHSEGKYATYGYYEGYDVSAAIDYLEKRGDCDIGRLGIMGESYGAAAAVMAAARDPRIRILIEDSAYPDLATVVADYGKALYGLPRFPLVDSALFVAGLRAGFAPKDVSPINEICAITVPTLIIHCTGDANIRPEYSQWMFNACGADVKELHYFDGCTHTMGYEDHTDEYEAVVLGFIRKNMR
ncbi:MAG: alpha/beta fold hydrolase [Deltaproteobacteria bacterium]|nr:alpha/beta fold hydrolase [Candidatus Zymogenaceae bacterium]